MKEYIEDVRELLELCRQFVDEVTLQGNESAWTDRLLEKIIDNAEELKEKYENDDIDNEEFIEHHMPIDTLCGIIYIEKFEVEHREEKDRIKLYDSDMNYLDYFQAKSCTKERYDDIVTMYKQMTAHTIIFALHNKIEFVGNREEMIDYLFNILGWRDAEESVELATRNDYINRIGETYLLWED